MPRSANYTAGFRWQLEWRISLFTALLVPLFVGLGFWQLARAEEKQLINMRWEARQAEPALAFAALPDSATALAYQQVLLQGSFLPKRNFLLDNRIRQGRYGVEVIAAFREASTGKLLLLNRGWIEADPGRRQLPVIPVPPQGMQLQGYVYVPPGESYTLGQLSTGEDWPRLVQAIDTEGLGAMLDEAVFPFTIRLGVDSPAALLADWPLVNTLPEKHQAYALQWFAMALALSVLFIWRSSNIGALLKPRAQA
ncbi:MAG: SURF1 family protein [Halieaceae bacterium]